VYENTEYVNFTYCITYARINEQSVGHGYKVLSNTLYTVYLKRSRDLVTPRRR